MNNISDNLICQRVGMIDTNCYLVVENNTLYIIDPGADAELIINKSKECQFEKAVILLTHAHVDHIGAVKEVSETLKITDIVLHSEDEPLYRSKDNHLMPFIAPAKNLPSINSNFITADFRAIHTPGHTKGGVCYYFESSSRLFCGDTLFCGSIGRTDLPGGDHATLITSIAEKLMRLPENLIIYPGHGEASTIGEEKKSNPYI